MYFFFSKNLGISAKDSRTFPEIQKENYLRVHIGFIQH